MAAPPRPAESPARPTSQKVLQRAFGTIEPSCLCPRRVRLLPAKFRREHRVAEVLARMGGEVTEFAFAAQGLTTWSMPNA